MSAQSGVVWAAMMLAKDLSTFESIMAGRVVRVRKLDRLALRRALRGKRPPPQEGYIEVTVAMLEAIDEEGPADLEQMTIRPARQSLRGEPIYEVKRRAA